MARREQCINTRDKVPHASRASKEDQYHGRFRCQRNLNTRAYILQTLAIKYAGCRTEEGYRARMNLPGNEGRTSVTVLEFSLDESSESFLTKTSALKVKTARPTVDVNPPEGRPHVSFNAKRLQLERERQARILRDNFILLKKLREIMHRKRRVAEDAQRVQWQESRCVRVR